MRACHRIYAVLSVDTSWAHCCGQMGAKSLYAEPRGAFLDFYYLLYVDYFLVKTPFDLRGRFNEW